MTNTALYRPEHKQVSLNDAFWNAQMEKISKITAKDIIHKFEHDHTDGIMRNYEWVTSGETGKHVGPPWYDGLICETIRGISDLIAANYDAELDERLDYYTDMIAKAQDAGGDGYINTYTQLMAPNHRFGENGGNHVWQHDIYNIGCLIEAGIHFYKATGKHKLLSCAIKAANYLCNYIGEPPKHNIVPAHSLPEEALIKLHRLLKDNDALCSEILAAYGVTPKPTEIIRLAKFFIDYKGRHDNRVSTPAYMGEYAQDHRPVTEQTEAVGHAVRAGLFYTGVAALAAETGDEAYYQATARLWNNVTTKKLHITGGIGASRDEEKFGYQYDLPNRAYLETCAGVALCFWAGESHKLFRDAKFIDVFERALYNNVLPCLSADGTRYFYENPLISDGDIERWEWHGCPCCPPMFLKLISAIPDYIYSFDTDSIYVNLYIGSKANIAFQCADVTISQTDCQFPWHGSSSICVKVSTPAHFKLLLRRQEYVGNVRLSLNGSTITPIITNGYYVIERDWQSGDTISVEMELPILKMQAHPYVRAVTEYENASNIAIQRGAFVYCSEEIDNKDFDSITLASDTSLTAIEGNGLFDKTVLIEGKTTNGDIKLIPYYLWNNRGKGKMAVWLKLEGYRSDPTRVEGWEGKLYRVMG